MSHVGCAAAAATALIVGWLGGILCIWKGASKRVCLKHVWQQYGVSRGLHAQPQSVGVMTGRGGGGGFLQGGGNGLRVHVLGCNVHGIGALPLLLHAMLPVLGHAQQDTKESPVQLHVHLGSHFL